MTLDFTGTTEAWRHWSHAFKSLKKNNFQSLGGIIHYRFYRLQNYTISSVQSLSHIQLFATPWTAACQASLSIINSQSPPKAMSIESVMPSNHLTLCHPLLLLPSIFPSISIFSNQSTLCFSIGVSPMYWCFSFNISPSNEHSGLISFRMDWLDLLAVQGTLKSLLQHHSSKASILRCSAFFTVQLSHPYLTTGKTIALTTWTFVGKVMSLLLNMLSRLVITFLPRSKRLLNNFLKIKSPLIQFLYIYFLFFFLSYINRQLWLQLWCIFPLFFLSLFIT